MKTFFEFTGHMRPEDLELIGSLVCKVPPGVRPPWPPAPDMTIAPNGEPYLFRWRLTPKGIGANVFVHLQIASDPERPLHDHPWDNQSVILVGGYDEWYFPEPEPQHEKGDYIRIRSLRKGSVVHRQAEEAHRLILPLEISYTISLFATGPKTREWGFYMPEGWTIADEVFKTRDF